MIIQCPHCQKRNRLSPELLSEEIVCGSCKHGLLSGPIDADQSDFPDILKASKLPVVVDFWAPWCGPCKMFAPTFKLSATRLGEKILHVKLDTQANPSIAGQYNIRSIPTLAVFKKGSELDRISGALSPAQLEQWLQRFV